MCALLSIVRSSYYYPLGENKTNISAMNLMDQHIQKEPTGGVITMKCMLADNGLVMSYERVRRLMRKAAIVPIYPRRHLTGKGNNEYLFPYLLSHLKVTRVNQVLEIDITYIPMQKGYIGKTDTVNPLRQV